ncbi:MAG: flagellar biosynthesis protein FlhF [Lysobacter sp.]|nr:flagellar biosynthesis protein FlhF [Lysobacter sp.]
MRIKRFVAPDMRTALRMVREEQGPDAVILSNRPTEGGIEIVAATDYDEALVQQALRAAAPGAEPVHAPVVPIAQARSVAAHAIARVPVPETVEATPASRADAMIAALTGGNRNANPARTRAIEPVARIETAPVEMPMAPPPAVQEPAVVAPTPTVASSADDFRALLARLVDAEGREPATPLPASIATVADLAPMPVGTPQPEPAREAATSEPAARLADVLRLDRGAATAEAKPIVQDAAATVPITPVAVAVADTPAANEAAAIVEPAALEPARIDTAPAVLTVVPAEDPMLVAMRAELAAMRAMMEKQMGELAIERLRGSPARAAVFDALLGYGCDDALAQTIASRIEARMDPRQARALMLEEFARMISVQRAEPIDDGGVIALVGPTGAGKTTTAAKLAARFAAHHRARDVALVTTDTERPGASEQLHTLGRRLGITVCEAEGPEGINAALAQLVDYPLVLVDTAGYAMRDRALLGQILWLRTARRVRSLLVLPANANPQDLAEVARRYRPASPEGVVLTKTDETGRLGAALSMLVRQNLSLAYTTCGQQVPGDLDAADPTRLVQSLEKLRRAADNPLATEDRHAVA